MTMYEIFPETDELKCYDPAVFCLYGNKVICAAPSFGMYEREDMDRERLFQHLETMRKQGFTVKETKTVLS